MTNFRRLIWMLIAAGGLVLSVSQSHAQQPDVGDQPGLLADDSVELDPEYRRTAVLYRSNEAPGTIVIATVAVGTFPVAAAVNATGTRVYVTNALSNTVSVIDTFTNTVVATVPVGSFPEGVAAQ